MFALSPPVYKVNGIHSTIYPLIIPINLYELIMQSLDPKSKAFENGITDEMFGKTHGISLFNLSATQDLSIV